MLPMLLAALLLQTGSAPAPPKPAAPPCARPEACRIVADFELRGPQGQRLPVRTGGKPTPWLPEGNIMLFIGETVTVRLDPEGGRLAPRLVRSGVAAARRSPEAEELRVSLAQAPDSAVVLKLESRLSRPVDYAVVAVSAVSGPSMPPTNTVPPGRTTTERWTGAVAQVALANFRFADTGPRPAETPGGAARVAGGRLTLSLGQTVVVGLIPGPGGALQPELRGGGPAGERLRDPSTAALAESAAAQQRTETVETVKPLTGAPAAKRPEPPKNAVRFTLGAGPDGRSVLLIVENGHDGVLDYRGVLRLRSGRTIPTTVCQVPPGLPVFESWSDPIASIELDRFQLTAPTGDAENRRIECD